MTVRPTGHNKTFREEKNVEKPYRFLKGSKDLLRQNSGFALALTNSSLFLAKLVPLKFSTTKKNMFQFGKKVEIFSKKLCSRGLRKSKKHFFILNHDKNTFSFNETNSSIDWNPSRLSRKNCVKGFGVAKSGR